MCTDQFVARKSFNAGRGCYSHFYTQSTDARQTENREKHARKFAWWGDSWDLGFQNLGRSRRRVAREREGENIVFHRYSRTSAIHILSVYGGNFVCVKILGFGLRRPIIAWEVGTYSALINVKGSLLLMMLFRSIFSKFVNIQGS